MAILVMPPHGRHGGDKLIRVHNRCLLAENQCGEVTPTALGSPIRGAIDMTTVTMPSRRKEIRMAHTHPGFTGLSFGDGSMCLGTIHSQDLQRQKNINMATPPLPSAAWGGTNMAP